MTQALNYTTKAISDLLELARISPNEPRRKGLQFVADLLRRAEVFVLPNSGQLLDRSKPHPEVPGSVFRPPFPVVALEYESYDPDWRPRSIYSAVSCSKRIALAWEWDGRTPLGQYAGNQVPPGAGVAMASVAYFDHIRRWVPVFGAVLTRYDASYTEAENAELNEALWRDRRLDRKQGLGRSLEICHILPLLPDAMAAQIKADGEQSTFNVLSADLMDEINAYRDLCIALACNNVRSVRHEQDAKLNKSRIRMGRPPFKDFHVLEIAGQADGEATGRGFGAGVRSHLRRGHIRRLGPDRITWVNACMVTGSRPGFAKKVYSVGEGGQ